MEQLSLNYLEVGVGVAVTVVGVARQGRSWPVVVGHASARAVAIVVVVAARVSAAAPCVAVVAAFAAPSVPVVVVVFVGGYRKTSFR